MIDPNLLRQLGWGEDLIAEVNRVAQSIDIPIEGPSIPAGPEFVAPTQSGTTFRFESKSPAPRG